MPDRSHLADVPYDAPPRGAMAGAFDRDEFVLHWQPIVAVRDTTRVGWEALVRWRRAGNIVAPDSFLPEAEAAGLSRFLDEWVLREACRAAASWPEAPRDANRISVNAGAGTLDRLGYADRVARVLDETGWPAPLLEIELTERTPLTDMDTARSEMLALQAIGCGVVLDDFGAGYASLAYLRALPFDKVKSDRGLLPGLGEDPRTDTILRTVIQLGHALGVPVCVEGVETDAQMQRLRALGCDEAQGFLLGRPGP